MVNCVCFYAARIESSLFVQNLYLSHFTTFSQYSIHSNECSAKNLSSTGEKKPLMLSFFLRFVNDANAMASLKFLNGFVIFTFFLMCENLIYKDFLITITRVFLTMYRGQVPRQKIKCCIGPTLSATTFSFTIDRTQRNKKKKKKTLNENRDKDSSKCLHPSNLWQTRKQSVQHLSLRLWICIPSPKIKSTTQQDQQQNVKTIWNPSLKDMVAWCHLTW